MILERRTTDYDTPHAPTVGSSDAAADDGGWREWSDARRGRAGRLLESTAATFDCATLTRPQPQQERKYETAIRRPSACKFSCKICSSYSLQWRFPTQFFSVKWVEPRVAFSKRNMTISLHPMNKSQLAWKSLFGVV